jgi:hypothetical protein
MTKPITITLLFSTAEQAQHVLEAYHESMGFGAISTGVAVEQATYAPGPAPTYPAVVVDDDDDAFTPGPTPTYNPQPEAPAAEVDERGVPYHPDFHSSSKKISKGAWNRRRGHDSAAADAYEAGFLGNGAAAGRPVTNGASPVAAHASPQISAPSVNAPGSLPVTLAQFQGLWTTLCNTGKVFMTDQEHIMRNWGDHPMGPAFQDPALRQSAYDYLTTCSYRA